MDEDENNDLNHTGESSTKENVQLINAALKV